uniref:Uncharacterized protein n=1 Tax=Oryza glumipatula TaxID=40148 RepID=A0A0D9ZA38_9ORYZ
MPASTDHHRFPLPPHRTPRSTSLPATSGRCRSPAASTLPNDARHAGSIRPRPSAAPPATARCRHGGLSSKPRRPPPVANAALASPLGRRQDKERRRRRNKGA